MITLMHVASANLCGLVINCSETNLNLIGYQGRFLHRVNIIRSLCEKDKFKAWLIVVASYYWDEYQKILSDCNTPEVGLALQDEYELETETREEEKEKKDFANDEGMFII